VAKRLAELGNNVSLLTLSTDKHRHFQAGPSLEEINVPRSFWHRRLDMRLNQLMGCGCDDASAALVTGILTREYTRQLRRELSRADAVLLSHPYMERVARRLPDSVRLFYDSHNSEYVLKEKLYKPTWLGRFLTWVVKRAEFRAARRSEAMFCVSGENRSEVALALPHLAGQAHVAPNGVDCRRCIVRGRDEKRELKRLAGLPEDRPLAVFLGSGHPPNAEAVRVLRDQVAGLAPDVIFGIIGSVAGWFHGQQLADNIVMLGPVETPVKDFLLQAADVALNPMLTGSGTSLKLFDYLAHGLPVISTPMGARGLSDEERAAILIAEPKDFAGALLALLASDERWREHSRAGRRLAEERYDWSVALRPFDAYFAPSSAR
jgi:glycosyltransferase involved in cell wall biosynthesis